MDRTINHTNTGQSADQARLRQNGMQHYAQGPQDMTAPMYMMNQNRMQPNRLMGLAYYSQAYNATPYPAAQNPQQVYAVDPEWYAQWTAQHGPQGPEQRSSWNTNVSLGSVAGVDVASGSGQPSSVSPSDNSYPFIPTSEAPQRKRTRRRYEEIERIYKCGWNGCEKSYGTLNHLNAHVTMQSHGPKRTPNEFKEIRKAWKQRKQQKEAERKAAEESQSQPAEVPTIVNPTAYDTHTVGPFNGIAIPHFQQHPSHH